MWHRIVEGRKDGCFIEEYAAQESYRESDKPFTRIFYARKPDNCLNELDTGFLNFFVILATFFDKKHLLNGISTSCLDEKGSVLENPNKENFEKFVTTFIAGITNTENKDIKISIDELDSVWIENKKPELIGKITVTRNLNGKNFKFCLDIHGHSCVRMVEAPLLRFENFHERISESQTLVDNNRDNYYSNRMNESQFLDPENRDNNCYDEMNESQFPVDDNRNNYYSNGMDESQCSDPENRDNNCYDEMNESQFPVDDNRNNICNDEISESQFPVDDRRNNICNDEISESQFPVDDNRNNYYSNRMNESQCSDPENLIKEYSKFHDERFLVSLYLRSLFEEEIKWENPIVKSPDDFLYEPFLLYEIGNNKQTFLLLDKAYRLFKDRLLETERNNRGYEHLVTKITGIIANIILLPLPIDYDAVFVKIVKF